MFSKRVVISSLAVSVAVACAQAEDQPSDATSPDTGGSGGANGGGQGGVGGKLPTAGSSSVSQGGAKGGASGNGGTSSGGKAGAASGGAAHAGASNGGSASGGSAGAHTGGVTGTGGGSAGSGTSAGTSAGGTSSTGLSCTVEAAAGALGAAGAGGAMDMGSGGAPALVSAFSDDFEAGPAKWTTTLGTWAVIDDGTKAYEQSVQENKLQIAIANGVCLADQVIDARVKVVAFKGQSNSYVAALFGRVVSPTTHYLLALGSDGKLALRKRVNSTSTGATAIGTAVALSITAGTWYDVHFEIIGNTLKGCVGAVCVTGTDASIASGSVGVGTVNTSARFDDVKVATP
jgi:hypothetical protein